MNEKERKNKQNNYDRLKVSKSMINVYIYNIYNNILYRYTLPNTNSTIINITLFFVEISRFSKS